MAPATTSMQDRIRERGMRFFQLMGDQKASLLDKSGWTGKLMDWCMRNERFKTRLFHFIDVMPQLTTAEAFARHVEEYFGPDSDAPGFFRAGLAALRAGGRLGRKALQWGIRSNIESMARSFILAEEPVEAIRGIAGLRREGYAFSLDVLGEATVSEKESLQYAQTYLDLLDRLDKAQADWPPLEADVGRWALGAGRDGNDIKDSPPPQSLRPMPHAPRPAPHESLDWGYAPKVNLSIKPSALYSQADPADFEGTVAHMLDRIRPVYRRAVRAGAFLYIDMESYQFKDLTLELFRRLRSDDEFRRYEHLAVVLQAYLRSTGEDLRRLLDWARERSLPIAVRLVKGAYWDQEVVLAAQRNWPPPVHTVKAATDAAFEDLAGEILRHHDLCYLACGSHNVRSVCAVMELADELRVPPERYEFQVLHGMAEPFRKALLQLGRRVRLYCPQGELLPGMAYLIRRLLENTSNESFLRQTFAEQADANDLLRDPHEVRGEAERGAGVPPANGEGILPARGMGVPPVRSTGVLPVGIDGRLSDPAAAVGHRPAALDMAANDGRHATLNEPPADFTLASTRDAFRRALAEVKSQLGRTFPLVIGADEVLTEALRPSVNPAHPDEVVARVAQAEPAHIDAAIAAAQTAFRTWRDVPADQRAKVLTDAAAILRRRIYEFSAWEVYEAGKQWNQAYNDVCEAIDTLEYYAREMTRLGLPHPLGDAPGEVNHYLYQPKGLAAVISPWNFPLAIACGMCSAAIVAGNCVLFKPSEHSPAIGALLCEVFRQAKLPPGVLNFVPGGRDVIGDYLVEHPKINLIAFTGSMEIGLRIIERAARHSPGQRSVKKVLAEMGGKNAILIDDDADLDETIGHVIESAFGYAGQKCSACSRLIVLDSIYDLCISRLIDAAASLRIGPPEDPADFVGPLISQAAVEKVRRYVEIARKEGSVVHELHEFHEEGNSKAADDSDQAQTLSPSCNSCNSWTKGFYAPVTIVEGIAPHHRLAQEEIFGPVLAVMRVKDFDQALEWANDSRFALTGAVFSRSPVHLDRARREFRAGNLYLNRGCTGAIVGRQPFGGLALSGVGTKAGGPDYLLQFLDARVVTENTLRRGFAADSATQ